MKTLIHNRYTTQQVYAVLVTLGFEPTEIGSFARGDGSIANGKREIVRYILRTDSYRYDTYTWGQNVNGDEWESRNASTVNAQDLLRLVI